MKNTYLRFCTIVRSQSNQIKFKQFNSTDNVISFVQKVKSPWVLSRSLKRMFGWWLMVFIDCCSRLIQVNRLAATDWLESYVLYLANFISVIKFVFWLWLTFRCCVLSDNALTDSVSASQKTVTFTVFLEAFSLAIKNRFKIKLILIFVAIYHHANSNW